MKIKNSKILLINLCLAIGVFIFLDHWHVLTAMLFGLWLVNTAFLATRIIKKILPDYPAINFLLGIFVSLWLVGSVANIFCSWLVFNNLTILLSLIITVVILVIGDLFGKNYPVQQVEIENSPRWGFSNWWLGLLLALLAGGFWLIWRSISGGHLISPWQVLPNWYGLMALLIFILSGFLVFSRRSRGLVLLVIILVSILMHSYLLVYNNGFGADRWRHLGSEIRLAQGLEYQPTLLTNNLWWSNIGPLNVPRALIDGPKLSYGFQWTLTLIGSKVFGVNLLDLDKYLVLILWSVFLPLLVFVLALGVWPQKQFALLAALGSSSFYLLQYYGSQTLPASLGLLSFVLFLVFIIYFENKKNNLALWCAIASLVGMYFGYSLAFILALAVLVIIGLSRLKSPAKYFFMGLASLIIFFIELFSQRGKILINYDILAFWRDGNLALFDWGKYLPHGWGGSLWLLAVINIVVVLIYGLALWSRGNRKNKEWRIICWVMIMMFINYLLSWQLLAGEHTLSRRLTLFVAPVLVLLVAWLMTVYGHKNKAGAILAIILFSVFSSLAYISGPVVNISISDNDVATAKYIWLKINGHYGDYCVLSGDSQVLPLEALSGKEVIAGNFPNGSNHQQPERSQLLTQAINNPSTSTFESALNFSKKKQCFLVLDRMIINQSKLVTINNILGQPETANDKYIWQFNNTFKK